MRVAIDARELAGHPTGVGRYLTELLQEWQGGAAAAHEVVLYSHRPLAEAAAPWPVRIVPGSGGTRWEQWEFARALGRDRPDVLFAPGLPDLAAVRGVVIQRTTPGRRKSTTRYGQ